MYVWTAGEVVTSLTCAEAMSHGAMHSAASVSHGDVSVTRLQHRAMRCQALLIDSGSMHHT
jgi:hypothetical protein